MVAARMYYMQNAHCERMCVCVCVRVCVCACVWAGRRFQTDQVIFNALD